MIGCPPPARRPTLRSLGSVTMPQTWGSAVHKADPGDAADAEQQASTWKWLLRTATTFEGPIRKAFLEALRKIKQEMGDPAELARALESGDVETAMRMLGVDEIVQVELARELEPAVQKIVLHIGSETPAQTMRTIRGAIGMSFNLRNPKTAEYLRAYNFEMIKDISDTTREGIRAVLQNAFAMGGHPYVQARTIREGLGLTANQEAAVTNYRSLLLNSDRAALSRQLRDRRYDATLNQALGADRSRALTDDQIDTMVGRYRQRMINMRATTIARTETIRAANAAQNMAWGQAAEAGLFDAKTARRFWFVTPDDRACPVCQAIPEDNDEGVGLDEDFDTELGPVPYAPAHTLCRCATYIRFGDNGGPPLDDAGG